MGSVSSNLLVQLSACVGCTPACNAACATVEKGSSGFYHCVNKLGNQKDDGTDLSTKEAARVVENAIRCINKSGRKIDWAKADQLSCWHTRKENNKLKNDFYFIDDFRISLPSDALQRIVTPAKKERRKHPHD